MRYHALLSLMLVAHAARADLPPGANTMCPVTTDEAAEARYSTMFEGRTIYFCCDRCRRRFIADPAAYAAHLASGSAVEEHAARTKEPGWARIGRLHPLAVHFPIALILTAWLSEWLALLQRRLIWQTVGHYCLRLGALGAFISVPLGWAAAGHPGQDPLTEWHRWLGIATLTVGSAAAWAASRASPRTYRCLLACAALLVAVSGHLGAALTHGFPILPVW